MSRKAIFADFLVWGNSFKVGSHNYIEQLIADGWEVLYLPGYWHVWNLFKDKKRWNECSRIWRNGIGHVEHNLYTYSPLTFLPYRRKAFFDSCRVAKRSLYLTLPYFPRWLDKNGWNKVDLLWVSNLQMVSLLQFTKSKKKIYRIPDNMSKFSSVPSTYQDLELSSLKGFDHIISTHRSNLDKLSQHHPSVHYVPNGVDLERFRLPGNQGLPPEYRNDAPKVVYVGAFEEWFDWKLLGEAVNRLPDFRFYLLGRGKIIDKNVIAMNNVSFLGEKSQSEIVPYLVNANVGIIPFKIDDLTNDISPIKLFEYCAAGLTTVTMALRETMSIGAPLLAAADVNEFVDRLREAVDDPLDKNELIRFAEANSWRVRYEYIRKNLLQ